MSNETKSIWLLLVVGLFPIVVLLGASVAHGSDERTYRILAEMPRHFTDNDEPDEARETRLRGIAQSIDRGARNPDEAAALITLARFESHLALYVQENRCSDGPRGKRECDHGRAHGLWQLHHAPQRQVPDSMAEQAKLAARLWSSGRTRCRASVPDEVAGAFVAYGTGGSCAPAKWADERAKYWLLVRGKL